MAIRLRGPASAPSAHAKADKQSQPGSLLAQISAVMHELQTSVETKSSNLIEGSRWTIAYLLQLRIQVAVALICFLVFQTQQVQDVLLALVLDQERGRFAWAALFGGILSLLLWHSSRQLTRLFPQIHRLRLRKGSSVTLEPQSKGIFSETFELVLFEIGRAHV